MQPIEHNVYNREYKPSRRLREDAEFSLAPEQSKKRHDKVSAVRGGVRNSIRNLLSEVSKSEDNRLTFRDIVDFSKSIESEWERAVSSDLKGLGVDMSVKFRLMLDASTGCVTASGDHPDKARIDAYFASTPDSSEGFRKIIQFGKLASVAESKLSPRNMNQEFHVEAMAWWYQSNMDTTSLFAGGGLVFGNGSSVYRAVDIRV